jgi:hypothetical protein
MIRILYEKKSLIHLPPTGSGKLRADRLLPENIRQSFLDARLTDRLRMNDSDDPRDFDPESSPANRKWVASLLGILAKEKHAVTCERIACGLRPNLKRSPWCLNGDTPSQIVL